MPYCTMPAQLLCLTLTNGHLFPLALTSLQSVPSLRVRVRVLFPVVRVGVRVGVRVRIRVRSEPRFGVGFKAFANEW